MPRVPKLATYKRQGVFRRRAKSLALGLVFVYLFSLILQSWFLRTVQVESRSMEPTLAPGQVLLVSPVVYGKQSPFGPDTWFDFGAPQRGDLVLVAPPHAESMNFFQSLANSSIELVTLGRRHLYGSLARESWKLAPVIRRVIAVPGDTVRMADGHLEIKKMGSDSFQSEMEAAGLQWTTREITTVDPWTDNDFFLAMTPVELKKDQYFLAADNRQGANDSRTWGPVHKGRLRARVLVRMWPPELFGLLD